MLERLDDLTELPVAELTKLPLADLQKFLDANTDCKGGKENVRTCLHFNT